MHETTGLRIDRWLWAARFFKTRALAAAAVRGGKVAVPAHGVKAARIVKVGDRLEISRGEEQIELEVLAVSARRGPASAAAALYENRPRAWHDGQSATEARRLEHRARPDFGRRPDKRSRRLLRHLTGKDAGK